MHKSLFLLLGIGVLLLGQCVKPRTLQRQTASEANNATRDTKAMPAGSSATPTQMAENEAQVKPDSTETPENAKTRRSTIAGRVKKVISREMSIETVLEQATYEDIGADQLDCAELMMAFESEFQLDIPDKDGERLCASTIDATISYISASVKQ